MKVLTAMFQFLTGNRHDQQAEISKAMAFQAAKSDVLRGQLNNEIQGLKGAEVRMRDYFFDLQVEAGRKKRGLS